MKEPRLIVKHPILSEKAMRLQKQNIYTFAVAEKANKDQIKYAVEAIYGVKVQSVNTLILKGKTKRERNFVHYGRRKDWKKAFVRLKEGHRLDII